jgi:hypothetical protein
VPLTGYAFLFAHRAIADKVKQPVEEATVQRKKMKT